MKISHNVPLGPLTSLGCGGSAETLATIDSTDDLVQNIGSFSQPLWRLGYGANTLVSDEGLPGTTLLMRSSKISSKGQLVIADAGAWWDDLVQFAIGQNLWGLELTSAIPGSVGAGVVGNIAAYGQAVADTLAWVDVLDESHQVKRLGAKRLALGYRYSAFQSPAMQSCIILRAAFDLADAPRQDVTYQGVVDAAKQSSYDLHTLAGRRAAVLDARQKAGSLWDYRQPEKFEHTAGSFFRNPMVSAQQAEFIMSFDETGRSTELLAKMNQMHGGDSRRVSAAHVLLAAGFHRGQTWGHVRLHPSHVLKIENTGGATAQQVYDVAQEIIATVKSKTGIDLTPEVRFLGQFEQRH